MSKKDINIKRTLLNAINEIKSDLHGLSLSDIINQFTTDINEYDKDTIERENKVILDFTDVYLLGIEDNNVFGKEVELIHIKTLKVESYTEGWERTYLLSGSRINFHKGGFYGRDFDTSVYSMYTEKDLRNCIKITKEEFESYVEKFNKLTSIVDSILNN
jgi:hypothetical protein